MCVVCVIKGSCVWEGSTYVQCTAHFICLHVCVRVCIVICVFECVCASVSNTYVCVLD